MVAVGEPRAPGSRRASGRRGVPRCGGAGGAGRLVPGAGRASGSGAAVVGGRVGDAGRVRRGRAGLGAVADGSGYVGAGGVRVPAVCGPPRGRGGFVGVPGAVAAAVHGSWPVAPRCRRRAPAGRARGGAAGGRAGAGAAAVGVSGAHKPGRGWGGRCAGGGVHAGACGGVRVVGAGGVWRAGAGVGAAAGAGCGGHRPA